MKEKRCESVQRLLGDIESKIKLAEITASRTKSSTRKIKQKFWEKKGRTWRERKGTLPRQE